MEMLHFFASAETVAHVEQALHDLRLAGVHQAGEDYDSRVTRSFVLGELVRRYIDQTVQDLITEHEAQHPGQ